MKRTLLLLLLSLAWTVATARAYTVEEVPRPNEHDATHFVSNPDGIIDPASVAQLDRIINALTSETRAETAVVALSSIGSEDINDFAVRLFKAWGIGQAGADNGLLLLFVLDQRKVRLETGYGIEGILPDAICSRIIRQDMLPRFREGDYGGGLVAGVERAASYLREEPVPVPEEKPADWGFVLPLALGAYILLMLISLGWMRSTVHAIRKNPRLPHNMARYNELKRQKAGITSVTGILFPFLLLFGGLFRFFPSDYLLLVIPMPLMVIPALIYARVQMRKMRRAPIPCDTCGGMMHILSEADEDQYLSLSQQYEEQLSAVDHDVFLCDACRNTVILTLQKPSTYRECPRCGTKALIKTGTRTTIAPTYISTGVEQTTYRCKFCGYEEHKNTRLPRLHRPSSAGVAGGMMAGSILRGGGGGFGGGSFGGGLSGGGGATGSW